MTNFGPKAVPADAALQPGVALPVPAAAGRHTSASICGTVSAAKAGGPTDSPPAVSALTAATWSRSRRLQSLLLASVHNSGDAARLRLAARDGLGCGCQRHSAARVITTPKCIGSAAVHTFVCAGRLLSAC